MPPRGSKAPAKTAPRPSLVIDRFHDTQRCIHYNCPQDEFTSFAHLQRHAYKFHRPRLLSGELDFSVPPEMPSSNKGDRYMFVRQYTADRSQGAVAVRNDPDPERWEDEGDWQSMASGEEQRITDEQLASYTGDDQVNNLLAAVMARGSAVDLEVQQRAATLQVDAVVAVKRAKEQETQKALEQVQEELRLSAKALENAVDSGKQDKEKEEREAREEQKAAVDAAKRAYEAAEHAAMSAYNKRVADTEAEVETNISTKRQRVHNDEKTVDIYTLARNSAKDAVDKAQADANTHRALLEKLFETLKAADQTQN